jgi:transcriptional regulator with GAF, ATPase, and Fis domain
MLGIRSVMCVPLRIGSEVLGTLYVDSRGEGAPFDERSLRFMEAVADQVAVALAYARLMQDLTRERDVLRETLADSETFEGLIGRSAAMRDIFELIDRVAPTTLPVIVTGESGTGKELVARAIHRRSARRDAPFLSENCAAIPEGLLESTLFGHVRGAFTGADEDRPGLFERAHQGTLLLDEIGDMSPALQAKLLRVLQEGELRRVGGAEPIAVDVRVIAATHRDLERLIRDGTFRQDLYFRLNGITVALPPLRDRREDIPGLVRHFLEVESAAARRPVPKLEPSVWRSLLGHRWPGNVRELHTAVRRLLLLSPEQWIGADAVRADPELGALVERFVDGSAPARVRRGSRSSRISQAQIEQALERTGGNRKEAAALLGISRATLYRKLDGGAPR